MPNHVHMVVEIKGAGSYLLPALTSEPYIADEQENVGEIEPATISVIDIVRNFKTFTGNSFYAKNKRNLWQRGYYDHIVSDSDDLERILRYVHDNPRRWQEDKFYCEVIFPDANEIGDV